MYFDPCLQYEPEATAPDGHRWFLYLNFDFTSQEFQPRQILQPSAAVLNSRAVPSKQSANTHNVKKLALRAQENIPTSPWPSTGKTAVRKAAIDIEKPMSVATRDSPRLSARGRRTRKDDGRWAAQTAGRKNRTIFTEEQHSALLAAYEADKYPTTIQKELLARQLGLAPIVVINWFQHRRQREPEKEKGGYVKNNSHSVEGTPAGITSSTPNGDTSNIPSFQDYNGKTTANGVAGKNGLLNSTNSAPAISPLGPNGATVATSAAIAVSKPVIPVNGTKPAPYYGRMQTVRPPNMSEAGNNGDIVPKSANAHIGQMRWELDPLYIAPYIDHGFKDALLPKDHSDNSSFALRPSAALLRK